jgi:glycosyltransferase involved in cell wall biosynthesis
MVNFDLGKDKMLISTPKQIITYKNDMRIIVFSENLLFNSGGAEVYALKTAEMLKYRLGYNETILLTYKYLNKKKVSSVDILKKHDIRYIEVKKINTFYVTSFIKFFVRLYNFIQIHCIVKKRDIFINCAVNRLIGPRKSYNVHIIHFPVRPYFSWIPIKALAFFFDKQYSSSYRFFLSNSKFTNKYLKEYWNIDGEVVYPPSSVIAEIEEDIEFLSKKQRIIIVGRIVPDKKIDEMIDIYLNNKIYNTGYHLLVVGNTDTEFNWYLNRLKEKINGHDEISIHTDVGITELKQYYLESEIFWHAKGIGVKDVNPLEMEHFGMTTVEAMACGCVPVVINKAGQKEIVEHGVSGYLWNTLDELLYYSMKVIQSDQLRKSLAFGARDSVRKFSIEYHEQKYSKIISSLSS